MMFNIPINEQGFGLFGRMIKELLASKVGGKAAALFIFLLVMLIAFNGLNIVNSYVGRDFITAITQRNTPAYLWQALLYIGVFAASTVVGVWLRYTEEKLGLLWRDWMTRRHVELYLQYPTYYRMNDAALKASGIENPDQRIADDIRTFTATTLSFCLMVLNGAFTVLAFSGVLWTISPSLFGVAIAYAVVGSYVTVRLGRPLVGLNYEQLEKEASFRAGLIQVREKAESIAVFHGEDKLKDRLFRQFDDVVANFRKIIVVNRNLGYFTTGYNYLIQIIPILLAAPLFVERNADFGVVTQAAMAFSTLVAAFSLIVTQFQSISSFAAVIQRLINLWYAIELAQTETIAGVNMSEESSRLAFEHLTLYAPGNGQVVVKDLNLSIALTTRLLVTGPDDSAKEALFKAIAGISDVGTGRVIRPRADQILFLPERPYLPVGSLREALTATPSVQALGDEQLIAVLKAVEIDAVVSRAGGLDAEQDWGNLLSIHEQQLIAFARILLARPSFAVLDLRSADFKPVTTKALLNLLTRQGIGYLTLGRDERNDPANCSECYDAFLELKSGGAWEWQPPTPRPTKAK